VICPRDVRLLSGVSGIAIFSNGIGFSTSGYTTLSVFDWFEFRLGRGGGCGDGGVGVDLALESASW